MPIYMDVHMVPGVKARDVAQAHQEDLLLQENYGCKCMTYWIDETRESVFCLIDAPSREVVKELHRKAHGLVPNKIIEVDSSVVESFLGRIYDPEEAETTASGLKVFHDPSFRLLLVTETTDPVLLVHQLGMEKAREMLNLQAAVIRKHAAAFHGSIVEHIGEGLILSFTSASSAIRCALSIQDEISAVDETGFRMGIHAGEPVAGSAVIFGDTIELARRLSQVAGPQKIAISAMVQEMIARENLDMKRFFSLSPADEVTIAALFSHLDTGCEDPGFQVGAICKCMAMSSSQVYRKTIELFNLSPNHLIKEYRLEKARKLLKKRKYTISQVTFDAGFTSPSYFTKCFKKKYGLLPMEYLDLLQ